MRIWKCLSRAALALTIVSNCLVAVWAEDSATDSPRQTANVAPSPKHMRVVLVLGGGGTRGAAHVGVLRVFEQEGVPIDAIVGTSIGAIVGGLYCAGVSIDSLEKRFDDGKLMKTFMNVPLTLRIVLSPIIILPRLITHPYDGLYKGTAFRKYLNNSLPESERLIEELKIPFRAVCTNLVDGKVYALSKGNLGYALQASSAVPGLRKPVQIGDQLYCDGGIMANLPVAQAREEFNPDMIIAVDADERFYPVPLDSFRKIGSVSARVVTLQLDHIDKPQCKAADIVLHPNVDGVGLVSTNVKLAKRALQNGEKSAREAMPAIKAKLEQLGIPMDTKVSEK